MMPQPTPDGHVGVMRKFPPDALKLFLAVVSGQAPFSPGTDPTCTSGLFCPLRRAIPPACQSLRALFASCCRRFFQFILPESVRPKNSIAVIDFKRKSLKYFVHQLKMVRSITADALPTNILRFNPHGLLSGSALTLHRPKSFEETG